MCRIAPDRLGGSSTRIRTFAFAEYGRLHAVDAGAWRRRRLEPRLKPDVDLAEIADWASNLPGAVVRIAATLHIAYYGADLWRCVIVDSPLPISRFAMPHERITCRPTGLAHRQA
jgi:hypothetical protein